MLVAAFVCWLAVIIFSAAGAVRLASTLVSPKAVDVILLPGTFLARLGLILGLLVSGGSLHDVPLIGEPRNSDVAGGSPLRLRAWFGAILTALIPIAACAAGIVVLVKMLGVSVARATLTTSAATQLPSSINAFWAFLRGAVDLMESTLSAAAGCNLADWRVWVFFYLLICFALRMTATRGNLRGVLGALALIGAALTVCAVAYSPLINAISRGWPVISLVVATNLLLLLAALLARGISEVSRAIRGRSPRHEL
ncbi:MAG: hypothetical protein H6817_05365 [Phycisphaerales bacterium]|nr:hypothetical protein [Phycisphaerales bacterium]